jgi:hypothetical protein
MLAVKTIPDHSHPRPTLREETERYKRQFDLFHVGKVRHALEAMVYGRQGEKLRPLLILNTVEFPAPPPVEYCEQMRAAGLQIIYVRRPGFGRSSPQPSLHAQAISIVSLIRLLNLENVVLLGVSSSNPVAYRLPKMCDAISLSIFSNPVFNRDILSEFQPEWFQAMLRQAITSQAGLRIAMAGMKYALKRDPIGVYLDCCKKSWGDAEYIVRNPSDAINAAGLTRQVDLATLHNDICMSLRHDPALQDGYFEGHNAIALSGVETTETWQAGFESEAQRLGLPYHYGPSGDGFVALSSPDYLLNLIKDNTDR